MKISEQGQVLILSAAYKAEMEAETAQKEADAASEHAEKASKEAGNKMMVAMELRNLVAMSKL